MVGRPRAPPADPRVALPVAATGTFRPPRVTRGQGTTPRGRTSAPRPRRIKPTERRRVLGNLGNAAQSAKIRMPLPVCSEVGQTITGCAKIAIGRTANGIGSVKNEESSRSTRASGDGIKRQGNHWLDGRITG